MEAVCTAADDPLGPVRVIMTLRDDSVAYRLKRPRRGGATHRVLRPLEMMARLAALVPPPRVPLLRYHGYLAPAARRLWIEAEKRY